MSCISCWRRKRNISADHVSNTSSVSNANVEPLPANVPGEQSGEHDAKVAKIPSEERKFSSLKGVDTTAKYLEYSTRGTKEDIPVPPYQTTPESTVDLPAYNAYEYSESYPEFPKNATNVALRASRPPQSSFECAQDKHEREETEEEQGQYLRSIKYGDQANRQLDELERFREEQLNEVQELSGLTAEQIERRRRLNQWDETEGWDEC
ncbi:hypothetical protein BDV96DRAFT_651255 [Lophiotrema nucula]|uniref:Uncharacterized protein n=1 Tax=Lophiotrema nucula TaxID=690887 RepID=A0A6A5YSK5_9PLEO|nr:hypothetical protein BDV96DRAFT_651255 [Lophiotrema nucula]